MKAPVWTVMHGGSPGVKGTQQSFMRGGSALRSSPLPFYKTIFSQKRCPFCIPSIAKWYPLNNNNNDRLFNLFAAQTELQGGLLITYKYFGIMTRRYNC